jgi:hypothetical protein
LQANDGLRYTNVSCVRFSSGPGAPRGRALKQNLQLGDEAVVDPKRLGLALAFVSLALVGGCVSKEDLDAWQGVPVAELDKHPFFLTVPFVRTTASDGTEIRNYVNGQNVASCSGGGSIFKSTVDMASYSSFTSCMQRFQACNNIFYIKDGRVQQYIATGTGGAICMTNETLRPGYRGSRNF